MISWITSALIKTYLATNGNLVALAYILIAWLAMFFIFYPFVKAIEKNDLEEIALAEEQTLE